LLNPCLDSKHDSSKGVSNVKHTRILYLIAAALLVRLAIVEAEEDSQSATFRAAASPGTEAALADTSWAVWSRIDELAAQEKFDLQRIVTTSGVRGAEAREAALDQLYYRGKHPVPAAQSGHNPSQTPSRVGRRG
jgi:hypothetical protein